ncbi:MAG: DNA sulfur modification protein DndB [Paenibacillaceae bacterium]
MKIPAIRGKIGAWRYYTSVLSFNQINTYVKKIDDELHTSKTLSDMIQRSITDNYKKIKDYILNQEERFFNSLVLAVYDGNPEWVEMEVDYGEGEEFFNLGFLKLNGNEKIFPVDGQHRVEGIKAALEMDSSLGTEQIPVIFISHSTSNEGMQRTRRLFSTLNRYAKPVSMRDIIALDEDDVIAIITRDLLENYPLFGNDKSFDSKGKAIPETNKKAFTSVITLYDCNREIFKQFKAVNNIKIPLKDYLKYRPADNIINSFKEFTFAFWNEFSSHLSVITTYLTNESENPAEPYRNREIGGNLIFRPVGLLPFIMAILEIKRRNEEIIISDIISHFNNITFALNQRPWKQVIWNDVDKTIIGGDNILIKLLLLFMYDKDLLKENELNSLKAKFGGKLGLQGADLEEVLDNL